VGLLGAAHASITLYSIFKKAMEVREVDRVDVSLVRLKIIALVEDLTYEPVVGRHAEKFVVGK